MADALDAETVARLLTTQTFGRNYRFLPQCGSTNDLCAEDAREGAPEGTVVVSDAQTGGRGRMGRTWFSPPGESLYFSILLRPSLPPASLPPLTLVVGASVAEALSDLLAEHGGHRPQLKWPNDVLLRSPEGPRKVAGILTEMATGASVVRHVVVGIGLNINGRAFPPEISQVATSLFAVSGFVYSRAKVLARVLERFEAGYARFLSSGLSDAVSTWRSYAQFGNRCRFPSESGADGVPGGFIEGWSRDVDAGGALILEDDHGRSHRIVSGDGNS